MPDENFGLKPKNTDKVNAFDDATVEMLTDPEYTFTGEVTTARGMLAYEYTLMKDSLFERERQVQEALERQQKAERELDRIHNLLSQILKGIEALTDG